jgi:hypothetical protein
MLVGAIVGSTPALPAARAEQAGGRGTKPSASAPAATHAVRGIVKSVGATSLVIARSNKKLSDLVFVLTPSTMQAGTITVAATVGVRYRREGNALVATAVTVDPRVARSDAPGRGADRRLGHHAVRGEPTGVRPDDLTPS